MSERTDPGGGMTGADPTPRPALDEAWKEAEDALPDGWLLWNVMGPIGGQHAKAKPGHAWFAQAGHMDDETLAGYGETPVEALQALAARLREAQGGD